MLPQFSSMANGIKSILHLFTLAYCYSLQCVCHPPHFSSSPPSVFSFPHHLYTHYISHAHKSFPFFWFLLSFSSFRSRPFCVYIFFLFLLLMLSNHLGMRWIRQFWSDANVNVSVASEIYSQIVRYILYVYRSGLGETRANTKSFVYLCFSISFRFTLFPFFASRFCLFWFSILWLVVQCFILVLVVFFFTSGITFSTLLCQRNTSIPFMPQ